MRPISEEDILIKALEMQEQGKSHGEIYAAFPDAAGELKQYFALTENLRAEAKKIVPSRELLQGALRRAAAEQAQMAIRPVASRFFDRVPVVLRILGPAFAMAIVLVLADRLYVSAPSPLVTLAPDSSSQQDVIGSQTQPQAKTFGAAVTGVSGGAQAPSAPSAAPTSPSAAADQVTNTFLSSADSEQKTMSDTSAAQQAAQANDSQSAQAVASPTTQP